MSDFKDHILYATMTVAVITCATVMTITGHLDSNAMLALLGAAIPTGLGLGKQLTVDSTNSDVTTTDTTTNRPI